MKNRIITISLSLCWGFLCLQTASAQYANVTFNVQVNRMEHYEGGVGGNCWESGDEEYTGYAGFSDNTNGAATYTGCFTCSNNGNCTYGQGVYIGGRTNNADRIDPTVDGWEDDGGSRCSHDSGDDCRTGPGDRGDIFFRTAAFPSNTYNIIGVGGFGDGDFRVWYNVQWNYAGTANAISPQCYQQSVGYTAGGIRSWSVFLTAGRTYQFGTCGAGIDTYIRIYGSDGFTIVGAYDDNGPLCATTAASGNFTASSTGWHYIEVSQFSRAALSAGGTLTYEDITPPPGNPAVFGNGTWNVYGYYGGNIDLTGEYYGFYTEPNLSYNTFNRWCNTCTPADASGWQGCYLPVDNHVVVSKRTGFTCGYYQLDIPNHDDDIRVYVNGVLVFNYVGCCQVWTNIWQGYLTSTSTIEVRHLEGGGGSNQSLTLTNIGGNSTAPSSISGVTSICSGTTSTLTQSGGSLAPGATYQWFSGSCGGTFLGTGNSITVTPSGTTNYFVRATGTCNTTGCASTTVSPNTAPDIVCPANISVNAAAGTCAATVTYTTPVGTDNCAGVTTTRTAGLASGSSFPVGTTTNTFVATDAAGLTDNCSFTVTVTDAQAPAITCPANISTLSSPTACGATVVYTAPTGTDNCAGATTTRTAGLASGVLFPVGVTTNTFVVTAANGATANCSFTVTVTDGTAPVITCPANISVNAAAGTCAANVTYTAPVGTDNCPGVTTALVTTSFPSGASFPVGTTTVTYRATAANSVATSCSFTVTVVDAQAPTITCPANISVNAAAGTCAATVTYTAPTGSDNCPGATTAQTAGLASGASFPVGTTTNTFVVTAANSATTSCSFTVTVVDAQAPTITCPANISVNAAAGSCAATVTYTAPTGADNCPGATTAQTTGLASGASFPVGTTTNTFVVTAANSATASCSFTVTVTDAQAPTITCPANISVNAAAGTCAATVTYVAPTGADNCPGATTVRTTGLASGSSFPVGTTTNTFVVTAANSATASCSFTVTVVDNQAPVITCPSNIVVNASPGACSAVVTYATPVGTDNCPGATTTQANGLASGATFPNGTTNNVFVVTAANSTIAQCSFQVTVIDNQAPTITCPANISVNAAAGTCAANVTYTAPVGTDNCGGVSTAQTAGLASGASFPVGTTTNTFVVTAANAATASCSFTVTVVDNQAPVITCPANISVNNTSNQCAAAVTYTTPVGTDNCSGASTAQTAGLASGASFPVGTTTNTFVVTAANAATASCSFTVTVVDNQAPTITCPANISVNATAGLCAATVTYVAPTGSDNCPGATTVRTAGLASGSSFPVGTTTNTFVVTAANAQTATCSFTVTVVDNQAPVITCPANISVNNTPNQCAAAVTYTTPVGTDNCSGASTAQTAGLASGASFPVGTTTNTFVVTAANAATASCSFTVTVVDNQAPTITCPANISVNATAGLCAASVTYVAPTGSDNCPGATTVRTAGLASGSSFPVGVTTNTFVVTAANAQTATCSFTVTVVDNQAPVITCPANISVNNTPNQCAAAVTYTTPVGTDNCSGASTAQTAGLASGASFPVGTTTNTFVVTAANAATATCSFTVTVVDNQAPVITCPANISVNASTTACNAAVTYVAPTGTDNCPGATTVRTAGLASGSNFPVGTTTNTFVVTAANGQTATCSFNVVVTDATPPTITCPANVTLCADASCQGTTPNFIQTAGRTVIANSGVDFFGGQGYRNWFYGEYSAFSSASFTQLPTWTGFVWRANQAFNTPYLDANGGHPGVNNLSWAVRRWISTYTGSVTMRLDFYDRNTGCGDGAHVRVFQNGVEIFQYLNIPGSLQTSTLTANISCGDRIDFVIDPKFDAGCDDTHFIAEIAASNSASWSDNCGIATVTQSPAALAGNPVGTTPVTLTATDVNGLSTSCTFNLIVQDQQAPVAICQPRTIYLNASGAASTTAASINNGSSDNCGVPTVSLNTSSFTCANTGANTVTLTATDASGNTATCTATVTVLDTIRPTISCPANISAIATSAAGATVTYTAPVGADNCPATTVLASGLASGSTFPIGTTTNTFTVTDASGNTAVCSFTVTVAGQAPAIVCPANITVNNAPGQCAANVSYAATDPAGIPPSTITYSIAPGSSFVVGSTNVTATATNAVGTSTCSFSVTVVDNQAPNALCQNVTVQLNASGQGSTTATAVNNGSSDNCGIASLALSQTSFVCSEVGANTETLTVTDVNGNVSTCTTTVTVEDNVAPVAICQNVTVQLDASGNGSTTAATVDNGSNDACGIASLALSQTSFVCSEVGANTETLTVTDVNGNVSTCTTTVTVEDNVAPVAICQNVTVQLDASGNGSTTAAAVNNGSSDACGIASLALSQTSFVCSEVGANTETLTVTDVNGNVSTCTTTITVEDNVAPVAICQNVTVQLDASGNGSTTAAAVNNGSSDACGIASLALSQTSFVCSEVGANTETLTVTDVNGNVSTCTSTVTVEDNVAPVAICQNVTVQLDASGNGSTTAAAVDNGSNDACGIASLALSQTSFVCSEVGANTETLTVTDVNGNVSTCTTTVTVEDNVAPVAICQNVTVQLDASGNGSTTAAAVNNGSSDACGIASLALSQTSFVCSEVGANTETLTVTDVNGNVSTCTATVTVEDNVAPMAICQNVTVQLDASGNGSTTAAAVNNGSSDACGIASLALSQTSFVCSEVGANTETLTVTDVNGNVSTCTATVTVEDNVAPVAICQNVTVQLDASGNGSTTAAAVDNGSNDACGIASLALSQTSFVCSEVGANTETLTVTDVNGNVSTCTTTITVEDNVAPVAICQNITVQLDASGNASITPAQINNGSSDACGVASLSLDITTFNCANVNGNTVTLTVTDVNGNSSTCTATVTIQDNVAPIAICQNVTVQLNASGNGSTTAAAVNNGSSDNCAIASLSLSQTSFVCSEVGPNTETLTVTDVNGNVSTCTTTVIVQDNVAPVAICQNVTVQLNASGNGSTTAAAVNNGSSDACGIASLVLSQTSFVCAEVGPNTETLTVTDVNGNVSTCSTIITVVDNVAPVAVCQNITVQLDASGNASITPAQINNGSSDACGIASLVLNDNSFNCLDARAGSPADLLISEYIEGSGNNKCIELYNGTNAPINLAAGNYVLQFFFNGSNSANTTVALTGTIGVGATYTVCDALTDPTYVGLANQTSNLSFYNGNDAVVLAKNGGSTRLDIFGRVGTDPGANGWTAAGGYQTTDRTLARNASVLTGVSTNPASGFPTLASQWTLFPVNTFSGLGNHVMALGSNPVTLTVTDVNGNVSTCNATVTVRDQVAPVAVCQNVTVQLNASGNGSTTAAAVNNGSSDACGIASLVLSQTSFVCSEVGPNTETLTVTDVNGNVSTCTTTITVVDNVAPVAICRNVTVQLDATGNGSTTAAAVNNGSSDACGIASLVLSQTSFVCSEVGANTETLTVTDVNGNVSTCTTTVTVQDLIPPVALCQNVTVQLDATGNGSTTAAAVNNGSTDACGIASIALAPTAFNCSDVSGDVPTDLFISEYIEGSGNNKCIELYNGTAAPINLGAGGYVLQFYNNGGTSANVTIALSGTVAAGATFTLCDAAAAAPFPGLANQTSNASFYNGNDAVVLAKNGGSTRLDIFGRIGEDPGGAGWTATGIATTDRTLRRNASVVGGVSTNPSAGFPTLATQWTNFAVNTSGGLGSHTLTLSGTNAVVLTVTDVNGNVSTCNAAVTVRDQIAPVAICQNVTVQLDATGNGSTTATAVNNGSSDACGIASLVLSQTSFVCSEVGANTETLTVTDVNGNVSTCTTTITVMDNVAPVAICQNVTVQLDATGNGSTTAAAVNNGSSDACGIASLALSQTSFVCSEVGANTETLTVTDVNGNVSTCTTTITVVDNVAPVAICQNVTVQLDATGNGSTTATAVNNGSNDACGIASLALSQTSFVCSEVGANTETLTVTDVNGNVSTCTTTITVEDNVAPVAICQNVTVQLDATGNGSTTAVAVNNGSNDACGIASLALSQTSFVCSEVGANTETLTVTDVNGNVSTCTTTITVEDNVAPVAICQNVTVQLDATGNGSTTAAAVNNGSNDACGIASLALSQTSFVCSEVGANTETLTVTDVNGNVSTCTTTITVEDNVAPVALCQNLTINLDSTGSVTVLASQIDNGSNDACGVQSISLAPNSFTCDDLGSNAVTLTVTDVNGNVSTCAATVTVTNDPLLIAITSPTFQCGYNISCNGNTDGSISSNTIGGCLPYTYLWSNGSTTANISGLAAGTYTVTVTDLNGNTDVATITLTEPAVLASTVSSPTFAGGWNVSCAGATDGSIDLSVSGGATCLPYTFMWSNGATTEDLSNIGAGTYDVTITDANGCSTTQSITLTEPSGLITTLIPQVYQGGWNVTCNGASDGMIFANTAGGTQPYSFNWSNGANTQLVNGLPAGTYTVTITDANGCVNIETITLTEPTLMAETISSATYNCGYNVSCNGQSDASIDFTVTGGTAPYLYLWSDGATTEDRSGLAAGTYSVTATDRNGCSISSSITLTEPALLEASISLSTFACGYNVSCFGANNGTAGVTPTGGCAPYSFNWSTGAQSQTISGIPAIAIFVTVTDANGCQVFLNDELTSPALLDGSGVAATFACGYNVSCNGSADGSIDYSVVGGCAPYTYLWNDGVTTEDRSSLAAGTYSVTVTDANGCSDSESFTLTEPDKLRIDQIASPTFVCGHNISCNGASDGSINMAITGGASCLAYTYQWSGPGGFSATTEDLSGLVAGTYSVTVTDANGCSVSNTITLTEPDALRIQSITAPTFACGFNISCNGGNNGSIDLRPGGGADCVAYSYLWSDGATTEDRSGLSAGTYGVTVTDANGCTTTGSITLTEPAPLTVTNISSPTLACGTNISCNGALDGAINLSVSGGATCGNYTYAWSNGAVSQNQSGLGAGTYTVTITDLNGCATTASITLTQPAPLTVAGISSPTFACGTNISCNGGNNGSINLTIAGGASCVAYTYQWSNGATTEDLSGLSAGTYTVTVTDANGCSTTSSITLTQPTPLVKTNFSSPTFACGYNVSCNGGNNGAINLDVAGACAPYTYQWSGPGGFSASTQDLTGLAAGNYFVTVTDANGCSISDGIQLTQPAALSLAITSPVRACGVNVSCNGGNDGVIQMTVSGGAACTAYTYQWSGPGGFHSSNEDLSSLLAGTYNVTVTDANGCSTTGSITLTQPAPLAINPTTLSTYAGGFNVGCHGGSDGRATVSWTGGASCLGATVTISGPVTRIYTGASPAIFLNLPAGTYTIVVVDANGCTTTSSFTLTQPAPLNVDAGPNATVYPAVSSTQCTVLDAGPITGGVAPYTVQWSTSSGVISNADPVTVCPTVTTKYYFTVTDANGCTFRDSLTVCVMDIVCSTNGGIRVNICHVPAGNPGAANTLCLPVQAAQNHINGHSGDYWGPCTVGGQPVACASVVARTHSDEGVSAGAAHDDDIAATLEAFPNPFRDLTTLRFSVHHGGEVSVKVYTLTGELVKTVFEGMAEDDMVYDLEFSANDLADGIYMAKLVTEDGRVQYQKLVLQR